MVVLIKLTIITVIIVLGLKVAMSENMLLDKLGMYFERKVDEGYKYFDLFICPWCMPTIFSIIAHGFALGLNIIPYEWNWQLLIRYPLLVGASSFIAGNLWNLYLTVNQIKEKNETETEYFKMLMSQPEEENNNN